MKVASIPAGFFDNKDQDDETRSRLNPEETQAEPMEG